MEAVQYRRSMSDLWIKGSLNWTLDVRFDVEIRALLDAAAAHDLRNVTVDLCGLDSIGSQHLVALIAAAVELAKSDRSMTVRAKGRVGELLQHCGLGKVAAVEVE